MLRTLQTCLVACAAAISALAAPQAPPSAAADFVPRTVFEARADFARDPVPQIQAHLAAVIAELESADVSGLEPGQRVARREQVARLADYAAAGVFPRNAVSERPTPVFIDDAGRACAVGHLMLRSGADALAQRIARLQNTAYVPEIEAPGLAEWLERTGLTAEECARIQPTYGPCGILWPSPVARRICSPAVPNSNLPFGPGFPVSGTLEACGSEQLATNDLRLIVSNLPQNAVGLFLVSRDTALVPMAGGGQGTLCLGGSVGRFGAPFVASGTGCNGWCNWSASLQVDLTALPQPGGPVAAQPGDTWTFQVWFRDQNPGPTSNFSDALTILFV